MAKPKQKPRSYIPNNNSTAINAVRKSSYFSEFLDGKRTISFREDAANHGMSLDEYVLAKRRFGGNNEDENMTIARTIYGQDCFSRWLKYQMTYVVSISMVTDYFKKNYGETGFSANVKLPFPSILVVMDLDEPIHDGHSLSFIFCENGDRIDAIAIVDDSFEYFPMNERTASIAYGQKETKYSHNPLTHYAIQRAWFVILFLSVVNKIRKDLDVRKVKAGGINGVKTPPTEWIIKKPKEETVTFINADSEIGDAGCALDLSGLIPPDERPIEIVASDKRKSRDYSEREKVSGYYRTVWTGKGRKIPKRVFVESYERGGKPGDETSPRTKVYK